MTDGLFLMQRYWGSEDEDSIEANGDVEKAQNYNKSKDSEKETPEPLRKRQKKYAPKFSEAEKKCEALDEGIITTLNKDNRISDIKSPLVSLSKKRKSKAQSEENYASKNENVDGKNIKSDSHLPNEENKKDAIKSLPASSSKKRKAKSQSKGNDVSDNVDEKNIKKDSHLSNEENKKDENFCTIGQVKSQNVDKVKPVLPNWLSKPTVFGNDLREQQISVSDLPYLDNNSKKNLQESGIHFLFPVQHTVIPWLMEINLHCLYRPSDLCVSAPTGSGKTLAFALPIVQSLKNRVVCAIRAVIVLPVSELAIQVYKVFEMFVRGTDLKVCLLTGQKSFAAEQKLLVESRSRKTISLVDIVVTTPGRILDHVHRTDGFCLKKLRYLVIDEADRMMDDIEKGWLKQIEDVVYNNCDSLSCACLAIGEKRLRSMPATPCQTVYINQPLQKLLFSATLSRDPEKLHTLSLYKPKLFTAQVKSDDWIGKCPIPDDLKVQSIICKEGTKPLALCHFIKERQFKKVLCFTDRVERAQRLHLIIAELGLLQVREISSNNRPVQRKIILEQFSSGKVDLLVCSDLVARGIDIEGVDCVVSYDVPNFVKNYVHRIGRTARAGKGGTAVTLLTEGEISSFKKMLKNAGIAVPSEIAIDDKDLEVYVSAYKNALAVADSKLRKIKLEKSRNRTKSRKHKSLKEVK